MQNLVTVTNCLYTDAIYECYIRICSRVIYFATIIVVIIMSQKYINLYQSWAFPFVCFRGKRTP